MRAVEQVLQLVSKTPDPGVVFRTCLHVEDKRQRIAWQVLRLVDEDGTQRWSFGIWNSPGPQEASFSCTPVLAWGLWQPSFQADTGHLVVIRPVSACTWQKHACDYGILGQSS